METYNYHVSFLTALASALICKRTRHREIQSICECSERDHVQPTVNN